MLLLKLLSLSANDYYCSVTIIWLLLRHTSLSHLITFFFKDKLRYVMATLTQAVKTSTTLDGADIAVVVGYFALVITVGLFVSVQIIHLYNIVLLEIIVKLGFSIK